MKLQLLSDLHLERDPSFRAVPAPGADTLILAGDIGSYQSGSRLSDDTFGLERFSPCRPDSPWRTVLYVPGNHEYDGLDFAETHGRLQTVCDRLQIIWLERSVVVLDGIRFVGTTLWSDFDALAHRRPDPGAAWPPADTLLTAQLRQREKAFRAANHYLRTNTAFRNDRPMLAEDIRDLALECQAWLREVLTTPFHGKTVVVTHFAPTLRSHDPRYGVTPGTAGFCNALDDLLPQADVWLHGHLHCSHDYLAEGTHAGRPFRCRVMANPLGYAAKGEQESFQPQWMLEVPGE